MTITIVASFIGFGILVFFHEMGHFLAAKKVGIRVEKFSLGMGPEIAGFTRGETRYLVSAIPFGGYCKLSGEKCSDRKGEKWEFQSHSIGERMFVIFMGPLFNFLLAFVLFAIVFSAGVLTPDTGSTVIGRVTEGYPAEAAGLLVGDKILTINAEKVENWMGVQENIKKGIKQPIEIKVQRGSGEMEFSVTSNLDKNINRKVVGISPEEVMTQFSIIESIKEGFLHTCFLTYGIVKGLILMVLGKVKADVGGPIFIMQMMGAQAQEGVKSFLYFVGFLSVNLLIINMLPIPIVDGGLIALLGIEGIRGKPLPEKSQQIMDTIAFFAIVFLMVFITLRDILRLDQVSALLKNIK